METQIRCFGCGKLFGNQYSDFKALVAMGLSESDALDELKLSRPCCRANIMTQTDVSEKIYAAGRPTVDPITKKTVMKEVGLYPERTYKYQQKVEAVDKFIPAEDLGIMEFKIYKGKIKPALLTEEKDINADIPQKLIPKVPVKVNIKNMVRASNSPQPGLVVKPTSKLLTSKMSKVDLNEYCLIFGNDSWMKLGWNVGQSYSNGELYGPEKAIGLPQVFKLPLLISQEHPILPKIIKVNIHLTRYYSIPLIIRTFENMTGEDFYNQVNLKLQETVKDNELKSILLAHQKVMPGYVYELRLLKHSKPVLKYLDLRLDLLIFQEFTELQIKPSNKNDGRNIDKNEDKNNEIEFDLELEPLTINLEDNDLKENYALIQQFQQKLKGSKITNVSFLDNLGQQTETLQKIIFSYYDKVVKLVVHEDTIIDYYSSEFNNLDLNLVNPNNILEYEYVSSWYDDGIVLILNALNKNTQTKEVVILKIVGQFELI